MKKRIALLMTTALAISTLAACGSSKEVIGSESATVTFDEASAQTPLAAAADEEVEQETDNVDWKNYKSDQGWAVVYDANMLKVVDGEADGEVNFVYTGEAEGINKVSVKLEKGKLPGEIIDGIKDSAAEDVEVDVSGGFFPGTTDKWAYWVTAVPMKEGSGPTMTYIIGEYNGGTIIFSCATTKVGDEQTDMEIADALALVIDSLTIEDFQAQTMYENIPGTYTQEINEELDGEDYTFEYSVTLNEDHTGVMSIQDEMNVFWDDKVIFSEDGQFTYNYTLDGDTLTIDFDGMDSVFYRK